jgi:catechol 2,3-dioxygenase-like lactoylglutathione lyase family enzyme
MKALLVVLSAVALIGPLPAFAQAMPPNEAGVTMGHWHLNSKDIAANKAFFTALGGTPIKPGGFEIVRFPGVAVFQHLTFGRPPSTGGTQGTIINHVGFSVPNVAEAVAKWKAAGLPVEPGDNGRADQAWFTTGDGIRIEILEDKAQTTPIRHHRVNFFTPAARIPDMQAWYAKHFGAKPGVQGSIPVAALPGATLAFIASDKPTVPTAGRVLDHIGFDVADLVGLAKKLEDGGAKLSQPINARPDGSKLTFLHDPWGTSIELNERPNGL